MTKPTDLTPSDFDFDLYHRQQREDDDERFQEAMIAAGYTPHIHTHPCTERPIFVRPEPSVRSRSMWGLAGFQ